ncbi:MAG: hypothetical protein FJ098_16140, partial [Deltaproteobacteria bacterium]|nr:hypothetical protein [Deltaproteobacteria bacterium]
MLRKLLAVLGSLLLFVVAFAVFLFLLVPLESISGWLQGEVNRHETVQLEIGEVERAGPGTIILRDIVVDLDFESLRKAGRLAGEEEDSGEKVPAGEEGAGDAAEEAAAGRVEPDAPPATGGELAGGLPGGGELSGFGFQPDSGRIVVDELALSFSPLDLLTPSALSVAARID